MGAFLGFFSGLGAMVSWGIGDFFAAVASKERGAFRTLFIVQLVGLVITAIAVLIFDRNLLIPFPILGLSFLLSVFMFMALLCFYKSLEIGPVSVTSPVASSYSLITVFISVLFLGERLTSLQWLAVFIVVLGIFLASTNFKEISLKVKNKKGIIFALVAMLLWGVVFAFIDRVVESIGWLRTTALNYPPMVLLILLIFGRGRNKVKELWDKGLDRNVFLAATLQLAGVAAVNFGFERELTSIVTTVSSTYPLITVILALTYFKEKVAKSQLLGSFIIILGLVLLALR